MTDEINYDDLIVPVEDELIFKTKSGKEIRLKMYYKQLLRLAQYSTDHQEDFKNYLINDNIQSTFIDLITCQFDDNGNVVIPPEIGEFKEELSADDAIKIATWCGEHVNNFFMKKLRNQEMLIKKNKKQYLERVNLLMQLGESQMKKEEKENSNQSENG